MWWDLGSGVVCIRCRFRQVVQAVRVIKIDNTGPVVTYRKSPVFVDPYVMDNVNPSVATVEYVSGPPITSVTFFKEMEASTTLIGTVTSPPWSTTVTAYEIATGGLITVKAVVYSGPGKSPGSWRALG